MRTFELYRIPDKAQALTLEGITLAVVIKEHLILDEVKAVD